MYEGHLLRELVCAGGSRWLDGSDREALRLTHGSQRLLTPEEAVGGTTPQERRQRHYGRTAATNMRKSTTLGTVAWGSSRYQEAAPENSTDHAWEVEENRTTRNAI